MSASVLTGRPRLASLVVIGADVEDGPASLEEVGIERGRRPVGSAVGRAGGRRLGGLTRQEQKAITAAATMAATPRTMAAVRCMGALSACMTDATPDHRCRLRAPGPRAGRSRRMGLPGRRRRRRAHPRRQSRRVGPHPPPPARPRRRHLATVDDRVRCCARAPHRRRPDRRPYLSHTDAELATARGAAAAGALFTLSTISSVPMEEVAAAAPDGPRWFQLYAPADRGRAASSSTGPSPPDTRRWR